MQQPQESSPAKPQANADKLFDLGKWLGLHQAFGLIASRCSAADARALQTIRENKLYLIKAPNWDEFCAKHTGVCRTTADRLIGRLQEFGETYFELAKIVPITELEYRALAPTVQESQIEFDGQRIPINRENGEKIAGVVLRLREQLRSQQEPFSGIRVRLDRCINELTNAARSGVDGAAKEILVALLENASSRLSEIYCALESRE